MSLASCARPPAPAPVAAPEPVVVVQTVRDTPPAELTRCPPPVQGLPTEGAAQIPADWRAGITRLARSRGALLDQLNRLIQFHTGEPCPTAKGD